MKLALMMLALVAACLAREIPKKEVQLLGISAFTQIEAEDFNPSLTYNANIETICSEDPITVVSDLTTSSYLAYSGVDFGFGAETFIISFYTTTTVPITVNVRLDSSVGSVLTTFTINRAGSDCSLYTHKVFLSTIPNGVHTLYLTFSSSSASLNTFIDYIEFGASAE